MVEFNLTDFDKFMYGCKFVLDSTVIDLQKWKPFYKPDAAYKACLLECKAMKVNRKEAERQAKERQQKCETMNAESKAHWEKTSFYANGEMKSADKLWKERKGWIKSNAIKSRSHLKNLIVCGRNEGVKKLTEKQLNLTFNRLKEFDHTHKMSDNGTFAKNRWFCELFDLVKDYYTWFEKTLCDHQENEASKTFREIFIDSNYEKHIAPLYSIDKPLLAKDGDKYRFLRGKGAICQYFYINLKAELKPRTTQDTISNTLVAEILDFGPKPTRQTYSEGGNIYTDLKSYLIIRGH